MERKTTLSRKYSAYPEYKDSEVDWLGDAPAHWFSTKIKYGYDITLGKMLQKAPKSSEDKLRPYLKAVNIQTSGISLKQVGKMWFSSSDLSSLKLIYGDVLISEGGDVGRSAIWRNDLPDCYIQNAINRARPKIQRSSRFLFYWMNMLKNSEYIDILCNKATIAHYTAEKVKNSPLFIPSNEEAKKIANFLDHETAKIDTLIEKQQQLIKLLKEKRQAVISHAVTKGLNPNATMRDSGVEWLGEVPEHWGITKISHLGRVLNGSTPDKTNLSYWEGGTIPWLASGCLNSEIVDEPTLLISEAAYQSCAVKLIPENSLLVGMVGQGKTRGTSAILAINSCINQNMAAIILEDKIQIKFLLFLFQAMYDDLRELGRGGNQAALNCEIIGSIRIPLPSIEVQVAIVEMLDKLLLKLSNMDRLGVEQIELLQERRTALISAAVTGKIDVRNWAAPEPSNINSKEAAA